MGDLSGKVALITGASRGLGESTARAMAAQGGGDYSDVEIGRAVVWLANQAGGKFAEPKAPAVAASAAGAASAAK